MNGDGAVVGHCRIEDGAPERIFDRIRKLASDLFVNGTLMRGLALHGNMAGAEFLGEFRTAPNYRLYSIGNIHPGMFEVESGGVSIAGELYRVPVEVMARIEAGEPPHLYRGPVRLADGQEVEGILYPRELAESNYRDISQFADWRRFVESATAKDVEE